LAQANLAQDLLKMMAFRQLFSLKKKRKRCRVYVSWQQTELSHIELRGLVDSDAEVKASTCKFNVAQRPVPDLVQRVDVPCFGSILGALAEMMLDDMFKEHFSKLGNERPSYQLDTMVQKKMGKVTRMCDIAEDKFKIEGPNKDAFNKVREFADGFGKLDPGTVPTAADWKKWIGRYVPDNYEENLSFDRMLSIFGVDDATAAAIRAHEISEERWLGKALIAFKPKGCLTDLMNLIFAMESIEPNKDMPEREIVETIKLFAEKIKGPVHRKTALQNLWIPDMLMHDAENDDMLCWVLLDFIRNKMDLKKLKVHIQLPESDKFETLERHWKDLGENVTTFKDVNSRNEAALIHNFGLD